MLPFTTFYQPGISGDNMGFINICNPTFIINQLLRLAFTKWLSVFNIDRVNISPPLLGDFGAFVYDLFMKHRFGFWLWFTRVIRMGTDKPCTIPSHYHRASGVALGVFVAHMTNENAVVGVSRR